MSIFDLSTNGLPKFLKPSGGLKSVLETSGRFPPIELLVVPLESDRFRRTLDRFTSYEFKSSILTPVDTFSFSFVAPDSEDPYREFFRSGDICVLSGNDQVFCTGIIDDADGECLTNEGETINLSGRDLMSQLEDNDSINIDNAPAWGQKYTVDQVAKLMAANTRIQEDKIILQDAPKGGFLFATEPGESKLQSLQRYLEPLNCLAWTGPNGELVIGRPNMAQARKGRLFINKEARRANVLSMKVIESWTKVPNVIVPIWSGQELVTDRVGKGTAVNNAFAEATRLRKAGHRTVKTVVVSNPTSTDPQGLSAVNTLEIAGQNILGAYAKREIARANTHGKIVQVVAPGHYNELGEPYSIDTVYKIEWDRWPIDEDMYLYEVEYRGSAEEGQRTILKFCQLGTIVSDVRAR